jgi:hypothetical protein
MYPWMLKPPVNAMVPAGVIGYDRSHGQSVVWHVAGELEGYIGYIAVN